MGFFDDVVHTVQQTVSTVSNTVNQVASDAGNAINSIGSDAGNTVNREVTNATDGLARSDVGKITGAGLAAPTAGLRATENVFKGNFRGAAGNIIAGANQATNPLLQAGAASPTVNQLYRDETFNKFSFNYGSDLASVSSLSARAANDGFISEQDQKDLVSFSEKSAAIAGLGAAGVSVYSWASANPGTASLLSTVGSALAKGDLKAAAAALGVPPSVIDYIPNLPGAGPGDATPFPDTSDPRSTSGSAAPIDGHGVGLVLAGVAAIGVAYYFAKKR